MVTAFEMDVAAAEEFFRRCEERQATTQNERVAILIEMAKEGKLRSIVQTKRTMEQYIEDTKKNFGKVLYVGPKKGDSDATDE